LYALRRQKTAKSLGEEKPLAIVKSGEESLVAVEEGMPGKKKKIKTAGAGGERGALPPRLN